MKAPHQYQRYIAAGGLALLVALAAVIGIVDSTTSFRVCFGALLFMICVCQLKVAADLYKHRNNLLLQLFQPGSLSLFVAAGAIASIASLLFAFSEYDATCALRQPIILTSITFMGNILIGRTWRIGSIISSTTTFAASSDDIDAVGAAKLKVMNVLSKLSQLGRYVGSCGRAKFGGNSGIRRAITFADSIFVVMVLLIPQLVLQIVNLSVPSVRMGSVEIIEGEGHYTCESRAGPYVLIVGVVLAATPFVISLLINIESEGIPDKFRELDEIAASMTSSFWMLLATLPSVGMIGQTEPNARSYLMAASVLSFVLPLSYNIAQTRLQSITMSTGIARGKANSKQGTSIQRQTKRTSSNLLSSTRDGKVGDDPQTLQAAEERAVMGKMFGTMGSTSKAVAMNRDILTLFKVEGDDFSWETGFTLPEIHSLGPKSLEVVVKTLVGSAKLWHKIFLSNPVNEGANRMFVKCCTDALDIFEIAPAKKQLSDRSVIFPGYCFMNVIAKMMTYTPPNNMSREEFEKTLAENFVKETHYQQYHQCRALAFQADVMKRFGKYEDALSVIDEMKSIYDPQLHSRVLVKEYVTDQCSDLVAASTFWLHHFGRNDEALRLCDQVVETMLPEIESTELLTKLTILTPICRTLTNQTQTSAAKKALELYRTHVSDPVALAGGKAHPVLGMRVPIMIILKCYSSGGEAYDDLSTDVAYMLNRKDLSYPVFFETGALTRFDAAWSTICAEACLCLAKITGFNSHDESSALIKEGLKCLEESANTLEKEDGTIVNSMAHSYHSHTLSELENLSAPV
uniref:G-protein coupled receptors family 3 profile domain-containing protein n=1 Tax=Skeletonema marinoi TaxID=267567 RepID=A0A7S2LUJ2_9STRA|mmetsp:Transcript_29822/g.50843  ORF Transcript_29822/g.50843 Transcript_29822/m.50843 type:complete len:800 (+) Transcript_29822:70-2469(+)